jgi:predicted amidohydrolase
MRIALVQQHASTNLLDNRQRGLDAVRQAAAKGAQVICFAELAFDPFYPQEVATPELLAKAEPIPGPTTDAFAKLAAELGVVLVLNLFERDGQQTYDTSPVIHVDGSLLGRTRMIHITDYACFHERGYYAPGDGGAAVYNTSFGKIGVAICYDRHFPEYMRVAAFQNGYFTALCNRVGEESKLTFAGESFVCDPFGQVIARAGKGTDEILYCDLDYSQLDQSSARRLFLRDRRPELYGQWL